MNHPRHPFNWRAKPARVGLLLTATIAFAGSSQLSAAGNDNGPSLPTPDLALPVVAPKINLPGASLPSIALPSINPTQPSVDPQTPTIDTLRRTYELKVADHRRNLSTRQSHADRIEYADALIHLERYDEAVDELEAIEEKYAEAYANAHLLSVAHELSANLPAACRWTRAAIERDPEAQQGTGWLRLAMMEARIALKTDSKWLEEHSVLDGFAGRSESELIRAVEVQVLERREFFRNSDPVLCDLYFQIGMRMRAPEEQSKYFTLSLEAGNLRRQDIESQQVIRAQVRTDGGSATLR